MSTIILLHCVHIEQRKLLQGRKCQMKPASRQLRTMTNLASRQDPRPKMSWAAGDSLASSSTNLATRQVRPTVLFMEIRAVMNKICKRRLLQDFIHVSNPKMPISHIGRREDRADGEYSSQDWRRGIQSAQYSSRSPDFIFIFVQIMFLNIYLTFVMNMCG